MATIEYIAILVSIVVGLAMAEVLQGFADVLRHRRSVRSYWPLMVMATLILMMAIWTVRWLWLAEDQETWNWAELAIALVPGLLVFVMARLCFPQDLQARDLRDYYFEQSRVIWTLAAVFVAVAAVRTTLFDAGVTAGDMSSAALLLRSLAFLLCLVLAVSKEPRIHEFGLALALLLMIGRIATSYVAFGG